MLVAVSTALIDGEVTPATFTSKRFLDDDVLALIGLTEVEISDDFSNQTPAVRNCLLEATDAGGTVHIAHGKLTAEGIGRGPSDAELEAKFHDLNAAILSRDKRNALLETLWHIDRLDEVGRLIDQLAL